MTANNAPSNIRPVGMDSTGGHSGSVNNGVGGSSGRADAYNTEESSAALPGAATQRRDYKSSPAPFMTNPNYRITPPSPGPDSVNDKSSGFSQPGTTVSASTRMSTWVSPTVADAAGIDGSSGDAMQVADAQELRTEYDVLPYEVHTWSSHSANFMPHNILSDRPHDQASRWATNANNHRQFITLRLERPALVRKYCRLSMIYASVINAAYLIVQMFILIRV
ncbi:Muskelin 1, intracellular mediator containing kelch motif [Coemansia sp. RSA 2337]|nr:Muskelin 1, intracellular mediator containing kelch motif [Coemansia sp. RSA 2337]